MNHGSRSHADRSKLDSICYSRAGACNTEEAAKRTLLRSESVLVDEPAELVVAANPVEIDHLGDCLACWRGCAERWPLPEGTLWPMRVEVLDVGREDALEGAPAEDQDPVEALAAETPDPVGCENPIGHAAMRYSWISPPSRSRLRTRFSVCV